MRKVLAVWLILIALLAAACGGDDDNGDGGGEAAEGPSGAQTYEVDVDAAAPPQFQVSAFFPGKLTVRPGDTIVFTNKSKGYPHTVTLGVNANRDNSPALVDDKGTESPVIFGPCFTDTEPTPQLKACPTPPNPAAPPAFAGKGYWNSGIIANNGGPTTSNKTTLKLADTIPAGDYTFLCAIHAFMAGMMTVAETDADRITPTALRADAEASAARAIAATAEIKSPTAAAGDVTAGWGDRITAVNLYDPQTISIKSGETVTWKTVNPYEPHTVTFESPFKTPADEGATAPAGVKSGGNYTGGFTSSGLFGPPPIFPSSTFSLKFTKAGSYKYVCAIHPAMTGTVTVT